jgi:lathosterol oxidase
MWHFIERWFVETCAVYALLLALYVGLGLALSRVFDARRPRLQARDPDPQLVRRDFRQSVRSLFSIAAFFALGSVLQRSGFGFAAPHPGAASALAGLFASLFVFDTWFYWGHRLLHTRPLFKRIHGWHHVTKTPSVWSNNSDSFPDNCVLQSYWLFAHFLFPVSAYVLIAHKIFDQVTGMIGHSGHEYTSGRTEVYPFPMVAVLFHDQHHLFSRYNYATHFSLWDRWMGTLHPSYERDLKALLAERSSIRVPCASR